VHNANFSKAKQHQANPSQALTTLRHDDFSFPSKHDKLPCISTFKRVVPVLQNVIVLYMGTVPIALEAGFVCNNVNVPLPIPDQVSVS
jgi:hypothetical protein